MSIRRLTLTTLISLWALAVALLLGGTAAQASVTHEVVGEITEIPATGPHGEPIPHPGRIYYPRGATIDAGELYVADDHSLDKFNASTGAFISQFATAPPAFEIVDQGLAVDHESGDVYTTADSTESGSASGAVVVYSATGSFLGSWNGSDTPHGDFECFLCSGQGDVAVDNSGNLSDWAAGDVYVSVPMQRVVDVFRPKAGGAEEYVTQLTNAGADPTAANPATPFEGAYSVAVDEATGDVFVVNNKTIDEFEPTTLGGYALMKELQGPSSGGFREVPGIAVDSGTGDIYAPMSAENIVYQFNSAGTPLGSFSANEVGNNAGPLAVDPETHRLYGGDQSSMVIFGTDLVIPDVTTEPASDIAPTSATLDGTVNPAKGGEATCRFDWGTSPSLGEVAPCDPEGVAEGESPVSVQAALTGLQPDVTYYYQVQATDRADGLTAKGETSHFTTAGPGIHDESTTNVASTSATLDARIDPNNAPTTYYFQYGTTVSYGADVPAAPGVLIGSGEGDAEVLQHLQGLLANTVYHYRVVAVSELQGGEVEVIDGADQTFVTQPPGTGFQLLDGRQWEMVSPPDKLGAELNSIGESGIIEASANGNAITFTSNVPTEPEPEGYALQAQELALRGSEGWTTRDLGVAHQSATGPTIGNGQEYRFFSEDLSLSIVQPFGSLDHSLSPEASEETPFLRTDYLNGNVEEPCLPSTMSCLRPLVTGEAGFANVPPGTVFGEEAANGEECSGGAIKCGPDLLNATPDLSHVVLRSKVPLVSGGGSLYEWGHGTLTSLGSAFEAQGSGQFISPRHGLSDDGSRVVFVEEAATRRLVLRDAAKGTVQLDAVQGGTGANKLEELRVQAASSNDSRVFFTDSQQLTADSHQGSGEVDLYECEMVEEAGKLKCDLTDLTPDGVTGSVLGASEDGSYVYFVSNGVMAEKAVEGDDNLYVRHGGATKLVAVLSSADAVDWSSVLAGQPTRVSPNGQWLTFMAQEDLTGYSTLDAVTGTPDAEVYLYDAAAGRLVCASCDPTGARPVGTDSEPLQKTFTPWPSRFAATVPGWSPFQGSANSLYQSRYLSNDGRVFFDSSDALVPQDVNGAMDVYEYEPPGVGNCSASTVTYSERSGGCVDLISSGTSAEESVFLDASSSGADVFFLTAAKLVPQDDDTALDIYDARECSTEACYSTALSLPPPCDTGDACKPSPSAQPPIFGEPSSATFSGAGNIVPAADAPVVKPKAKNLTQAQKLARALKACRKLKPGKARAVCERQARSRYASKHARKANNAMKKGGRG
jgi:hypothetical protein